MKKEIKVREEMPSFGRTESGRFPEHLDSEKLIDDVRSLVESSRRRLAQAVNSELVMLYWQIGRRISEDLPAENRAEYGAKVVELVSDRLTAEYGKGFRRSNMFHMNSPDTVWTVVVVPLRRDNLPQGSSTAPVLRRDGQGGALEREDTAPEDSGYAL
jgi:hypothetical protein